MSKSVQLIKDHDVKWIDLRFTDTKGTQHHVTMPARDALDEDFTPLTDWRATAEYRQLTAKNLLTRFFLETSGEKQELARFSLEEA